MTRIRAAIAACVAIIVTASLAVASSAATNRFYASPTGAQEVPSKGDPDGSARATLTVSGGRRLCYDIRPKKLETAQQAHIHKGQKGKAGAIFVDLFTTPKPARNGKITGCAKITAVQLASLRATPSGFYLNVHTKRYPSGAVRGQLSTKKP